MVFKGIKDRSFSVDTVSEVNTPSNLSKVWTLTGLPRDNTDTNDKTYSFDILELCVGLAMGDYTGFLIEPMS